MIAIDIPGHNTLQLHHLVLDYNGTMARDGKLMEGVRELLHALAEHLEIHVLTADTFGNVQAELSGIPCSLTILPAHEQEARKLEYIETLGKERTVCMGNGRNDRLMLRDAALGIAVIQEEGAAMEAITAADVVVPTIADALNLLVNPLRLVATLRS